MAFRMDGFTGEIRVGGRLAAEIGRWTLIGMDGNWSLTGPLLNPDEYWLHTARGIREVRLDVGARQWCFKSDIDIEIINTTVTIRGTGQPEVR